MQIVPVYDRYAIQMSRSRMIGLLAVFSLLFGIGCGVGIATVSHLILRDIVAQSERNAVLFNTVRHEAREVERQAAEIATRCGAGLVEGEL